MPVNVAGVERRSPSYIHLPDLALSGLQGGPEQKRTPSFHAHVSAPPHTLHGYGLLRTLQLVFATPFSSALATHGEGHDALPQKF